MITWITLCHRSPIKLTSTSLGSAETKLEGREPRSQIPNWLSKTSRRWLNQTSCKSRAKFKAHIQATRWCWTMRQSRICLILSPWHLCRFNFKECQEIKECQRSATVWAEISCSRHSFQHHSYPRQGRYPKWAALYSLNSALNVGWNLHLILTDSVEVVELGVKLMNDVKVRRLIIQLLIVNC